MKILYSALLLLPDLDLSAPVDCCSVKLRLIVAIQVYFLTQLTKPWNHKYAVQAFTQFPKLPTFVSNKISTECCIAISMKEWIKTTWEKTSVATKTNRKQKQLGTVVWIQRLEDCGRNRSIDKINKRKICLVPFWVRCIISRSFFVR